MSKPPLPGPGKVGHVLHLPPLLKPQCAADQTEEASRLGAVSTVQAMNEVALGAFFSPVLAWRS